MTRSKSRSLESWVVGTAIASLGALPVALAEPDSSPGGDKHSGTHPLDPEQQRRHDAYLREQEALRNAEPELQSRRARILEEIAQLPKRIDLPPDHWSREWAGDYYTGDGLGVNISVSVGLDTGFVYTWHGCMGLYDGNEGDVLGTFDEDADGTIDGIEVDFRLHRESGFHRDSKKQYFIRSENRRYVVPESAMLDLVNSLNRGDLLALWGSPMNRLDRGGGQLPEFRRPSVIPALPQRWAALVIRDRLTARITEVERVVENGEPTPLFTIDKGSADGVYAGLESKLDHPGESVVYFTITSVAEHHAHATLSAIVLNNESIARPAIGSEVVLAPGLPESSAPAPAQIRP